MEIRDMVRSQLGLATQVLGMTMADVTQATADKSAGNLQSIGAIYAHAVADLDFMTHAMVQGKPLVLAQDGWAAKTGIPVPTSGLMTPEWLAGLKVDIAAAQEYAKAVIAAADSALANLGDDVLNKEMDGPFGKTTGMGILSGLAIYHISEHTGEIAALKGVLGGKGLPF
ncbi:MAG: DinB family protein [Dehalococcoidia bacterium]